VAEKTLKMIRIKWVRSGIGFTQHQKTIVRSLGLNKLNHTVVRPDTPQIRGIVAAVPHLLQIVAEAPAAAWASIPEYTVHTPVVEPAASADSTPVAATEAVGEAAVAPEAVEKPAVRAKAPRVTSSKEHKEKEASPKASKKKESAPKGRKPAKASKK
jgi:large subunit ribosomal protein L30